ncbi:hypothetical protein [Candidatus Contubernalis alkaliaceticus]|uniref:hypothetical protein n=1 Tax=Candidatus Contubernalis alkaliaceticus TaxID=338645 RepID=UPI001F4BECAB|nr:hypothetical protein [Candidatus Contubernalis alkalaceticus]UNC93548.1 hypothetical protein HUE98_16575 [Candidatus Contubernalis alkalaceticus]
MPGARARSSRAYFAIMSSISLFLSHLSICSIIIIGIRLPYKNTKRFSALKLWGTDPFWEILEACLEESPGNPFWEILEACLEESPGNPFWEILEACLEESPGSN